MHQFTWFERICLLVTVLVLALMLIVMVRRQQGPAKGGVAAAIEAEDSPSAVGSGGRQDDAASDAGNDEAPDFAARARDVPRPDLARAASAAPNLLPEAPVAGTNTAPQRVKPQKVFGAEEIARALEKVASMPWSPEAERLLDETVSKWAATDPAAALDYALQIESRRIRAQLVSSVFTSWARNDLNGAYGWLQANRESSPEIFRMALKPVFSAAASRDLSGALRMAAGLGSGADRMSALGTIATYAGREGAIPSMIAFMDSLPTVGERRGYAGMLASNWALYAPEEASRWAMSLTDPDLRAAALGTAVGAWAGDNPAAAAAWVATLADTDLRSEQMARITQSWARYDPVKAADWLLSQRPPSTTLDPSVRALVGVISHSNPEAAVMWAGTIADPQARNSAIVNAARQWMRNDPEKASAYVASAPLTPAQRAAILAPQRRR